MVIVMNRSSYFALFKKQPFVVVDVLISSKLTQTYTDRIRAYSTRFTRVGDTARDGWRCTFANYQFEAREQVSSYTSHPHDAPLASPFSAI